jgi:hypothetical protein
MANAYGPTPPQCFNAYGQVNGPPACAPNEDCNGRLLRGDPLLDPACAPHPGWFGAVELDLVNVHIKNGLVAPVAIAGGVDTVHLPTADLEWTASPRFELGYRLSEGFGEFVLGYRSLVTEGRAVIPAFDGFGDGFLNSRLNLNAVDLTYASREYSLQPDLGMKWRVGVRLGNVYFDSRAVGLFAEERTSNWFLGAGPVAGLDLEKRFCNVPGLRLFTRLEGATLLGRVQQSFEEVVDTTGFGDLLGGATTNHGSQAVPILHFQAGVGYAPPGAGDQMHFSLGYDFEQWWMVGRLGDSRGDLTSQGILFRTELNY